MSLLRALAAALLAGCSGREYPTPRSEPGPPLVAPPPAANAACGAEGDELGGADAGARACCEGLTRARIYKGSILRLDECVSEDDGRAVCIRCGDARCGRGENTCNCPGDCHWP